MKWNISVEGGKAFGSAARKELGSRTAIEPATEPHRLNDV